MKRQFKLIQCYPGSSELGIIVSNDNLGQYIKENPLEIYQKDEIENWSEHWLEITSQPLFTTKDGVGILPGDGCYWVKSTELDLIPSNYACDSLQEYERQIKAGYIPFSTEEAAEKWIEKIKPKYHKYDMINFASHVTIKGKRFYTDTDLKSIFNNWLELQKIPNIKE